MKKGVNDTFKKQRLSGNIFIIFKQAHEWFKKPRRIGERTGRLGTYILMFDLSLVFMFPFLFMLVTSLKTNADLHDLTVNWVPRSLKLENYVIALRALNYTTFMKNSLLITIVATIGHLLACPFIGYGFARYKFPGKKILFSIVIVAFIIPVQTNIVPMYIMYANLKWLNSYLPVLIPTFFGYGLKGALFIFIFRQFYLGLPKELESAAKIDGCGFLMTYWRIVFPVAQSAFLVTLVLSIVWHWNDFYEPAIYASRSNMAILPARLNKLVEMINTPPEELFTDMTFVDGENTINNAVLMAGTFMVVLPVLAVFSFLQKKFMQGIERTGLTGE